MIYLPVFFFFSIVWLQSENQDIVISNYKYSDIEISYHQVQLIFFYNNV